MEELRRAIANQRGRDDFDRVDAPSVSVRVRRIPNGALAADVQLTSRDGSTSTRSIDGAETCSDLVRAAALTIALALEEDAASAKPVSPPPPVTPPVTERAEPLTPSLRSDHVVVTAAGLTSLGLLPRPGSGAGLMLRARIAENVWLSARGLGLPAAAMPNDDFAVNLLAGGAGACIEPFGSRSVAAVGCAHLVAGSFDVTRAKVLMTNAGVEPYLGASLSAGVRGRLYGPIHLEGAVDGQLPFIRPTYLASTCPVRGFEPSFAALALWLGAGMSFH